MRRLPFPGGRKRNASVLKAVAKDPPTPPEGPKQVAVIVPGVIESMLVLHKGTPQETPFYRDAVKLVKKKAGGFLLGAARALLFRDHRQLNAFGEALSDEAFGALAMTPAGESVHPLETVISGAAESSYAAIHAAGKWPSVGYGAREAAELAGRIGGDNVFVFCYDWRQGVVKVASLLRDFLKEVTDVTGAEELDLWGCSYGCQVIAQYLYAGGGDKVRRIVFNAPAWQGTALFRGLLEEDKEKLTFRADAATRVLTRFAGWELDLEPYARLLPKRLVRETAYAMIRRALLGGLLYAPGLWSCCADADYDRLKEKYLDPVKSAALIAQTDAAHYGVMRRIPEVLAAAREKGISLWAVMNDGTALMAGDAEDGDGVIDAATGSGGVCLPKGQRLPEERRGRTVSPDRRYDLCDALLPDRTWVVTGQVHGQSFWDDATRGLIADLLLTGKPETTDSDPAYPRFLDSHCPADGVSLRLTGRAEKILRPSEGPRQAVIRNDSERKRVLVLSATVEGLPYRISKARGLLAPGESRPVTLAPEGAGTAPAHGEIAVRFIKCDPLPLLHRRAQTFRCGEN